MKGKYQTPSGEIKEVHDFDPKNKIVSVHVGSGQYTHHAESEYKDWEPVSKENENTNGLAPTVFEEGDAPNYQPDDEDDKRAGTYTKEGGDGQKPKTDTAKTTRITQNKIREEQQPTKKDKKPRQVKK